MPARNLCLFVHLQIRTYKRGCVLLCRNASVRHRNNFLSTHSYYLQTFQIGISTDIHQHKDTLKYYNFLTENEAEEIVAAFQNQDGSKGPKWRDPDELFEKVEQHDGRVECEPYYNKWALYVAMNKAASDQNSVILKWIGDDKDKYIIACYDLALTDLKDKDRPYWIRKYFHVESKF